MRRYTYDGSFEGLLSVLAVCSERPDEPEDITSLRQAQSSLFGDGRYIETSPEQANRFARALERTGGSGIRQKLYRAFLTERSGIELILHGYARSLLEHGRTAATNLLLEPVAEVERLNQRIGREVHRMHAFVRFSETEDGLFSATIAPEYDVLPLIYEHFERRFAQMRWMIVDARRGYGVYYDGEQSRIVSARPDTTDHSEEPTFRRLWRAYYDAAAIEERANPRLLLQHMPRRYWKYLTEMQ